MRRRNDASPPRRPSAAELADTVKYELIDPSAADTEVGMTAFGPSPCRRRAQLAAMVAVVATAIAGYVTMVA